MMLRGVHRDSVHASHIVPVRGVVFGIRLLAVSPAPVLSTPDLREI